MDEAEELFRKAVGVLEGKMTEERGEKGCGGFVKQRLDKTKGLEEE